MIARLAFAILLLASPAHAGDLSDYAYAWPLALEGESAAWQFDLSPEVYEFVQDESLRDLEVFDASGTPVPLAPLTLAAERRPAERVPLPVFRLRRGADGSAWDLRVQVARGTDRSIHRLDAQLAPPPEETSAVIDQLLDASRLKEPIEALWLTWPKASGDTRARFAVEASDDLEHWRTLLASATVLELHGGGETLERRRIDLPATRAAYLRLRSLDPADLGELQVEAQLASRPGETPAPQWLETTLVSQETLEFNGAKRGVYTYETKAAYPVDAVRVVPQVERSLAHIEVRSRPPAEKGAERWVERASFTLVRLEQGDEQLLQNEAGVSVEPRSRTWRIEASPPLDAPPRLLLSFRPDRFAFLSQGSAPFVLAAGSHVARRTDAPLGVAIGELRARLGSAWRPPTATLGERSTSSGERALEPPPAPLPWKTWILWAVLVAGAGLVAALAVGLLRRGSHGPAV